MTAATRPALRIGIACFSTFGGSGVIAAEVATSLARRGHRVHLFSDQPPGRLDLAHDGAVFHQVAPLDSPPLDGAYPLALTSKIVEVARRETLDIIHAHYALPHAVSAYLARQVLAADRAGTVPRIVTTLHGTDSTLIGNDPSFLALTRFSILSSDAVTAPSAWLAETTYRNFDLPRAMPIDVIPNFVDTQRFCPATDQPPTGAPPVIVHVSNFRPLKRVDDVVRVFARVRAQRPARLCLVGDGPDRPRVEALARTLEVAGDVIFLGERIELPQVLRAGAVFLLTSETESFGLAALEAMACGVPVVASDVGGLPEVVTDGETGFLRPLGDLDGMAAAVRQLLDDGPLRQRFAEAARRRAETRFQTEPAVDRYQAVYRRVLG